MACAKCERARKKLLEMVMTKKAREKKLLEAAKKFHRRSLKTTGTVSGVPHVQWENPVVLLASREAWDEFTNAIIEGYRD